MKLYRSLYSPFVSAFVILLLMFLFLLTTTETGVASAGESKIEDGNFPGSDSSGPDEFSVNQPATMGDPDTMSDNGRAVGRQTITPTEKWWRDIQGHFRHFRDTFRFFNFESMLSWFFPGIGKS